MQSPIPTKSSDLVQPTAEKKQRVEPDSSQPFVSLNTLVSLTPTTHPLLPTSQTFRTDRILHENPLKNDPSQINLSCLDFDLQHTCEVTSQTFNLFMCLSCGKTLSGKHASSPVISHANKLSHYLYICLDDTSIWLFPDDYEIIATHPFDSIRENCTPSQMSIPPSVYAAPQPQPPSSQLQQAIPTQTARSSAISSALDGQPYLPGIRPFQSVSNSTWLTSIFLFLSRITPLRDHFLNVDTRSPTSRAYLERLSNLRQLETQITSRNQSTPFDLPLPSSPSYGTLQTASPLIHNLALTMKKLFHTHAIHNYIHPFFSLHFFHQFLDTAPQLAKLSEFDRRQPQTLFTTILTRLQLEFLASQSKQSQTETMLQQHLQGKFEVHTVTSSLSTNEILAEPTTTTQPFFFLPIQAPLELQQSTMSQHSQSSHLSAPAGSRTKPFSVELTSLLSRFTGAPQITESIDPKTNQAVRITKTMHISQFPSYLIFVIQRRYPNHNTGVDYSRAVIECPAGLDFKPTSHHHHHHHHHHQQNIKYDLHANISTELNISQQQSELGGSASNKDLSWNQQQKATGDANSMNPSDLIHNIVAQRIMPYKVYLNDQGGTNRWYCINNLSVTTAPQTEKEAHQSCSVLLLFKLRS